MGKYLYDPGGVALTSGLRYSINIGVRRVLSTDNCGSVLLDVCTVSSCILMILWCLQGSEFTLHEIINTCAIAMSDAV